MVFAILWHESAMDLHVFPIQIFPPTSLRTPSFWVFPLHQPLALVSCIHYKFQSFFKFIFICYWKSVFSFFFFFLRNRKLSYSSPRHTYFYSVSQKCIFATPWAVICQASLSMGFPRQEYSVHPFLLQGIFLIQGSNLRLLLSREFFTTELSGKGHIAYTYCKYVTHWIDAYALNPLEGKKHIYV